MQCKTPSPATYAAYFADSVFHLYLYYSCEMIVALLLTLSHVLCLYILIT